MLTMTKAPCYSNGQDCVRRRVCAIIGRTVCTEWNAYELKHKEEVAEVNKKKKVEDIINNFNRESKDYKKTYSKR